MASADGSVIIEIDANDKKALNKLDEVQDKAEKVSEQISGNKEITFSLNISEAERELSKLKNSIYKLTEDNRFRESLLPDLESKRDELTAKYKDAIQQDQDENAKSLAKEIDTVNRKISQYQSAIDAANQKIDYQKSKYGEITQAIQAAGDKARQQSSDIADSGASAVGEKVAGRFRTVANGIASNLKNAAKSGLSAFKLLSKGIGRTIGQMNVFSRISGKLGGVFKQLGSTIKSALVFSVIYQGISMVKQQLGSYLMANAEFTAALGRLKGVLLTAFQPIYDVVVPALVTLMNVLSSVIAAISRFTSALFGRTAKQSQTNAKALYGQAKATEAAGSAAEEAAGSLAAFDEINTIQTENAGGGGGGGGGGAGEAGAPEFDFDYGEEAFQSWGEAFNAFLGNILENGIPRLREGLLNFADWLNGFSQKLYDMFTFPGVKEKVIQIGQDLANALNDMVNRIDWNLLGMALGAGLNLAILGIVSFLYTFDWINLGMKLAALINGMVSQIDWYAVGKLLWSGFKIAIETLAGFILGLNMPEMAAAASQLVIGFCDSFTETLQNVDWQEIGNQIALFFASIDWAGVAESAFTALGAAFGAASAFAWGLIEEAWKNIVQWWRDTAYQDGEFTFEGLLQGILDKVKSIGAWIREHIFKPFVDGFKSIFGIHSPSTVMMEQGRYIMDGLFDGIKEKISPVINLFKTIFDGFIQFIQGVFTGKWKQAWDGVKKIFTNIVEGIKNTFKNALDFISGLVGNITGTINKVMNKLSELGNKGSAVSKTVRDNVSAAYTRRVAAPAFYAPMPTIAGRSIPALAAGAVIPPNREFLAVLGDQRSGTNIEAPLSTIEQAVENVISRMGGAGGGDIHITVELDGRVVARNTVKHINDMTRSAGTPVLLI